MKSVTDPAAFTEELVGKLKANGFGTVPKRDLEIFVLHLLFKYGYYSMSENTFEIAKDLRITDQKLRNYIKDMQMRYDQYSEEEAKVRFSRLFSENFVETRKDGKLVFQVSDALLKQYLTSWTKQVKGFSDTSFNTDLVVVSKEVLADVVSSLAIEKLGSAESAEARIAELFKDMDDPDMPDPDDGKGRSRILAAITYIAEKARDKAADIALDKLAPIAIAFIAKLIT